ncbi:MAG: twin-arginine translocation signal domain-containing protein, partial [Candidatus Limnocylindrales bacterium]
DDSRLRTAARCVIDRRDFLKGTIALGAAGALSPMSSTALNAEIAARKAAEAAEAAARIAADDALSARIAALESPVITPPPVQPPPAPPASGGMIGPGVGFDGLANTTAQTNQPSAFRFRAGQSAPLATALVYVIANGNTGYSSGTGGSYRPTLQTCAADGTPSGTVLATANTLTTGNPSPKPFYAVTFPTPYTVRAGTLYCLVFTNIDASGSKNYISLDGIYTQASRPYLPKYPDTDWAWLYGSSPSGGKWTERNEQVPILDIGYANGVHEGVGYMESSYGSDAGTISGLNQCSDLFTLSAAQSVSTVGVQVYRNSGIDPLVVTIGGVSVSIPSSPIGGSAGHAVWVSAPLDANLAAGSQRLVLSCASTSSYGLWPIRSGVASYGFAPSTVFGGNAQKSADGGKTWSSLGRVANQNDLPFYLR